MDESQPVWQTTRALLDQAGWLANPRSLVDRGDGTFVLNTDEVDDRIQSLLDQAAPEYVISAEATGRHKEQSVKASPERLARYYERNPWNRPVWLAIRDQLSRAGWADNWQSLVEKGDGTHVLFVDEIDDSLRSILRDVSPEHVISPQVASWRDRAVSVSPRERARRAEERLDWLTPRYRSSEEPQWVVIRRLVRSRSIEVESSWLADVHGEGRRSGW